MERAGMTWEAAMARMLLGLLVAAALVMSLASTAWAGGREEDKARETAVRKASVSPDPCAASQNACMGACKHAAEAAEKIACLSLCTQVFSGCVARK